MGLMASVHAVATPGHTPRTLMTLGVALLFAAIYLLGGRANQVLRANRGCGGFTLSLPESP